MVPRWLAALGLLLAIGACSGETSDADSIATAGSIRAARGTPAGPRPPITPTDTAPPIAASADGRGLWTIAALEKRLDLQGMAPRRMPAPVQHPFMSVTGTAYQVGNAELQVFIYDDAEALGRDVTALDTVTVAPVGERGKWPTKVTFIRNSNLAAILLGENALQIERVQRALMAGLTPGA